MGYPTPPASSATSFFIPPPLFSPFLQGHLSRVGEERCAFARVMVFANKAMQSKSALEREAANWVEEAGTLPPGESS